MWHSCISLWNILCTPMALENDSITSFKLHTDILLWIRTGVDLCDVHHVIVQIGHMSHMNIMCSHMHSQGNGEECNETTQLILCKPLLSHLHTFCMHVWMQTVCVHVQCVCALHSCVCAPLCVFLTCIMLSPSSKYKEQVASWGGSPMSCLQ